MFIVFDLDGTLALIDHRRHFVAERPKRWKLFFEACTDDAPYWPVINTLKAFLAEGTHRIEIWSGRSDQVRPQTEAWLTRFGLGDIPLKMRHEGDFTPDDQLKEQWLLAEAMKPDLIFDDRDKVVAMWRRHGIACAQVAPGDF